MTQRICQTPECTNLTHARGLCAKHYARWYLGQKQLGICKIPDCTKTAHGRGWCSGHYRRWQVHGDPQAEKPLVQPNKGKICSEGGCELPAKCRGFCASHYTQWNYWSDPERRRAYARKYHRDNYPLNPKKWRAKTRDTYASDPQYREKQREWRKANRPYIRALEKKRVARKEQAVTVLRKGRWTPGEDAVLLRDNITILEMACMLSRSYESTKDRRARLLWSDAQKERKVERARQYYLKNREHIIANVRKNEAKKRALRPGLADRSCPHCESVFTPSRNTQRYCRPLCSKRNYKQRLRLIPCQTRKEKGTA